MFLEERLFVDILVQGTGQRTAKTRQVGAAVALGNVISKAVNIFLIGIIPLQRGLYCNAIFLSRKIEHLVE